ncbi:MAG: hypothetical protein ABIV94_11075 [Acidimicrobiales bacterium]
MTGRGRAVALLAVIAAAAVVGVGPGAAPALAAPCAAVDHVALVIDFGGPVTVECVDTRGKSDGANLLALGHEVQFNSSGLLCSIDGVPAAKPDGSVPCGERTSAGYAYWSYWQGTSGTWRYSSIGPAATRLRADTVQGWRWNPAGVANPSDPPPNGSADPSTICVSAPPATVAPPTDPGPYDPGAPVDPGAPSVGATPPSPTADTTPTVAASTASDVVATTTSTTARGAAREVASSGASGPVTATRAPPSGGSSLGVLVGIGAVGALGVGGGVMVRRRAAGP